MAVYRFLTLCKFNPTAGGTTDWTYSSIVTGYQSPTSASAANGALYIQRAESADLSEWEVSSGAYNSGTGVFPRTTVLYNSSGTGTLQGGAGTKINFSTIPTVGAGIFISPNFNGTGQIPGTDTNDNASAANIGEYTSASLNYGSEITLTTATGANVTSLSLTAGDWDVNGVVYFESSGSIAGNTYTYGSVSQTSATLDTSVGKYGLAALFTAAGQNQSASIPGVRKSLSGTTTIYLVAQAAFSAGTIKAFGHINARRVR